MAMLLARFSLKLHVVVAVELSRLLAIGWSELYWISFGFTLLDDRNDLRSYESSVPSLAGRFLDDSRFNELVELSTRQLECTSPRFDRGFVPV